uniref:Uncharacterized protein n=1 Tax=Knipowitschia caucasica TaxID=637954 RepID=A0AAV2L763_KNICA
MNSGPQLGVLSSHTPPNSKTSTSPPHASTLDPRECIYETQSPIRSLDSVTQTALQSSAIQSSLHSSKPEVSAHNITLYRSNNELAAPIRLLVYEQRVLCSRPSHIKYSVHQNTPSFYLPHFDHPIPDSLQKSVLCPLKPGWGGGVQPYLSSPEILLIEQAPYKLESLLKKRSSPYPTLYRLILSHPVSPVSSHPYTQISLSVLTKTIISLSSPLAQQSQPNPFPNFSLLSTYHLPTRRFSPDHCDKGFLTSYLGTPRNNSPSRADISSLTSHWTNPHPLTRDQRRFLRPNPITRLLGYTPPAPNNMHHAKPRSHIIVELIGSSTRQDLRRYSSSRLSNREMPSSSSNARCVPTPPQDAQSLSTIDIPPQITCFMVIYTPATHVPLSNVSSGHIQEDLTPPPTTPLTVPPLLQTQSQPYPKEKADNNPRLVFLHQQAIPSCHPPRNSSHRQEPSGRPLTTPDHSALNLPDISASLHATGGDEVVSEERGYAHRGSAIPKRIPLDATATPAFSRPHPIELTEAISRVSMRISRPITVPPRHMYTPSRPSKINPQPAHRVYRKDLSYLPNMSNRRASPTSGTHTYPYSYINPQPFQQRDTHEMIACSVHWSRTQSLHPTTVKLGFISQLEPGSPPLNSPYFSTTTSLDDASFILITIGSICFNPSRVTSITPPSAIAPFLSASSS